jgi:transcription-repair coupling factor (superfamily II helicase)
VLHVARDDKRAEAMRRRWRSGARVAVLEFPAWDCLPYDRVSPNPEISAAGWRRWPRWPMGCRPFVLLTTLNAVTQRMPAREVVRAASFRAGSASGWTRRG